MISTILTIAAIIVVLFLLFKIFSFIIRLVLIAVFLLLAYLTNPSIERHQLAVARKAEKTNTSIGSKRVVVSDYKVFSLTKIDEGDNERVVGAGLFTQVFIFGRI